MRYLYLTLLMVVSTITLYAQQRPPVGGMGNQMPPHINQNNPMRPPINIGGGHSIDSMLDLYILVINEHLGLTSKQSKRFNELYAKYYTELSELSKSNIAITDSTSNADLERQAYSSFNITDKTTELKRKYYPQFKEIISIRQILMMYDVERELLWRISLEGQRRSGQ